ncbi:Type II secretion system protein E [Aquicella siphonis]|uniref:Type II secretion system protein E n=1 Tax=Aquicella siphonis TaxID=254247 RepID=A0A5E4PIJ7_9COXI|nr:ATPase, T2SS/T4P/T4SS family [Aquicella siphonis]VVC76890.1 Type II secretion system protein E [Aquicella siphonis]
MAEVSSPPRDEQQIQSALQGLREQYAAATKTKIITSPADIDAKDKIMDEMFAWCKEQANIVVLKSATILSADPTSRTVQNCKSLLLSKGIHPGQVYAANESLLSLLLASGEEEEDLKKHKGETTVSFSDQQRHLRELVFEAVRQNVSDIHIQVRQTYTKIRMRQHGELRVYAEWSEKLGREIASVAFNKETDHATSHFNPLIPQDASMPLKMQGKDIRLRLASVPAHGGFDMVMRILATGEERTKQLDQLGYTQKQIDIIKMAMKLPFGAIIVAGPTGSGKTTTLASCMEMVESTQKLYSIEDPVEKVVEEATQVPVNTEKEDRSFASMGRAALRMDPDVIILGEMRDEDTAHVMVRASITGHLVLTTLHTNRATAIVTRLVDMGVSPVLLSDSSVLRCLMCQRLIAKVCDGCAIPLRTSERHQPYMADWEAVLGKDILDRAKARGNGCPKCNRSGVGGRIVVAEVIWVDEDGRQFIQKCDTLNWEKYLKENGWMDFRDRAIDLIQAGVCDPFDAEKVVGPINPATQSRTFKYS